MIIKTITVTSQKTVKPCNWRKKPQKIISNIIKITQNLWLQNTPPNLGSKSFKKNILLCPVNHNEVTSCYDKQIRKNATTAEQKQCQSENNSTWSPPELPLINTKVHWDLLWTIPSIAAICLFIIAFALPSYTIILVYSQKSSGSVPVHYKRYIINLFQLIS